MLSISHAIKCILRVKQCLFFGDLLPRFSVPSHASFNYKEYVKLFVPYPILLIRLSKKHRYIKKYATIRNKQLKKLLKRMSNLKKRGIP